MGPEGGSRGGLVIAEGTPEQVADTKTYTGGFLKPLLDGRAVPVRATQPALVPATRAPVDKVNSDKMSARRATVRAS
jgi:excinuclease ABC subunit A